MAAEKIMSPAARNSGVIADQINREVTASDDISTVWFDQGQILVTVQLDSSAAGSADL